MKLLTLNTHSLAEEHYERKLEDFIAVIACERPDIMALQEVNQEISAPSVKEIRLQRYVPCDPQAVIREGNHALRIAEGLSARGIPYHWTWLPIKKGYGIYDEGVAILSLSPIGATDSITASQTPDYDRWKTRRLLGIYTARTWFYSVHFGWWDDREEPFAHQWARTAKHMCGKPRVFLMGDFNSPAERRNEGYDLVTGDGWYDTYTLAAAKDSGITICGRIAGWDHRSLPDTGARVDHIFCNYPCRVASSFILFNGTHTPVVSDHFGMMATVEI